MYKIRMHTNKEPWLAASLSWLLPGIGHLYLGSYGSGTFLLVLGGFIYISWIMLLISTWTIIIPTMILKLSDFVILPICASWSAFRLTKGHNTEAFERERTMTKDPWLAVFLSVLLPGFGHIYLRKWIVGIMSFIGLCVIAVILRLKEMETVLPIFICRIFLIVHAYIACQVYKVKPKQPLILFIIMYICMFFLLGTLLPRLEKRLVYISGPMSGTSMNPTLVKGDCVAVNCINYSFNNPIPGDVIMFHPPKNISGKKVPAGKRIIAIGGETIEIREGNVYVDGQKRNLGFQMGANIYPNLSSSIFRFGEIDNPYLKYGVDEPYLIPEGSYFVMGDNRRFSVDSRCFGAISRENIIGKIMKIYWPPRRMGVVR